MNSHTKACFMAPILSTVACAAFSAEPISVALHNASDGLPISGVLGYARDCSFAIYQNRMAAIRREAHDSILLANDKSANAIDGRLPLSAYIGNYVLAKGNRITDPGIRLKSAAVYYSFGKPYSHTQRESVCVPQDSDIRDVMGVMRRDSHTPALQAIAGILVKEGWFYRLYSDQEVATEGAWSYAIDVRFKVEPSVCLGREVIVEGLLDKPRRRTGVALELVDARVIDSTCGEGHAGQ